jgi:hypothetical protein
MAATSYALIMPRLKQALAFHRDDRSLPFYVPHQSAVLASVAAIEGSVDYLHRVVQICAAPRPRPLVVSSGRWILEHDVHRLYRT